MRTIVSFNEGWLFTKQGKDEPVTLPHTWNAVDGQDGGDDYYRGTCRYTKQFPKPALNPGEEAWLEFKGAAYTADVSVNGEALCHHEGGFSTFRIKLPELKDENTVEVRVDNSSNDRVYPQKADFTFYGGLYRDVNLIIVPASHFELGYCGTSGIKVTPIVNLETKSAALTVETWQNGEEVTVTVDGQSKTVPSVDGYAKAEFTIENVHLWDGVDDPYLYTATATLPSGDRVSTRFGCRNYKIDPQKGFILNGRSYPLRGGARHQDCKGVGFDPRAPQAGYGDHPGAGGQHPAPGPLPACPGILRPVRRKRHHRLGRDPLYHHAHEKRPGQHSFPNGRADRPVL